MFKYVLPLASSVLCCGAAYAQVTGIPIDIHAGTQNGHFAVYDPNTQTSTWYGIGLSTKGDLAQFGVAESAFTGHTEIAFDLTGGAVVCPTAVCPSGSAPALANVRATWVALPIDGSTTMTSQSSNPLTLFGGVTPPTGYEVEASSNLQGGYGYCFVNDNGPAALYVGFSIGLNFGVAIATPPGYKPMGPVTVWCNPGLLSITANGPNSTTVTEVVSITARAY